MRRALAVAAGAAALFTARESLAAPTVWAIDDGEKIKQDAITLPFKTGAENPIWAPGQPVRLFALRNETVAFQVVVEADDAALDGVTVDVEALVGPGGASIQNAPGANDPTKFVGRPVERFVEHFFNVTRASGNSKRPDESLGWAAGSGPAKGKWTGMLPDALIPIEVAPAWAPYPLRVEPHKNGIVWIDVTLPTTQAPGLYKGNVVVKSAAGALTSLAVELEVIDLTLPDRPTKTMLYYDRSELDRRIGGGDAAEKHLWKLLHRHRLTAMHAASKVGEAENHLGALDGSEFTPERGYEGPGVGVGDGVLALGAYGQLGAPSTTSLAYVDQVANFLAGKSLLKTTDVFVYAIDEDCSSPYGKGWKDLLATSTSANTKSVRVGWTCSDDPATQPVDIAITLSSFDAAKTSAARAKGKEVWVYNGMRPFDGTFLTDTEAVSLRVNGWLGGMFDIGRWFYWETTFWYDDNRGGKGAYDPFATAETFHNADGDYCMGDGVLLYPGKQVDMFTSHSVGMAGVIASIRLKNWRRGIEDAGYYQLARAADVTKADAIAKGLFPVVWSAAQSGGPVSWTDRGKAYFDARKALLALIPRNQDGGGAVNPVGPGSSGPSAGPAASSGCGCRSGCGRSKAAGIGLPALLLGVFARRRRLERGVFRRYPRDAGVGLHSLRSWSSVDSVQRKAGLRPLWFVTVQEVRLLSPPWSRLVSTKTTALLEAPHTFSARRTRTHRRPRGRSYPRIALQDQDDSGDARRNRRPARVRIQIREYVVGEELVEARGEVPEDRGLRRAEARERSLVVFA